MMSTLSPGVVISVSCDGEHRFCKPATQSIRLVVGLGVEGDAHFGATVQHRSRVKKDPTRPNLRQVHLIHAELLDELNQAGFDVNPGSMGENVTTRGIDLLSLPGGTHLLIGNAAVIEITGLRDPCRQLDDYRAGLMNAVLDRDENGGLVRKAGIMGIVIAAGDVTAGDTIGIKLPAPPHHHLERV